MATLLFHDPVEILTRNAPPVLAVGRERDSGADFDLPARSSGLRRIYRVFRAFVEGCEGSFEIMAGYEDVEMGHLWLLLLTRQKLTINIEKEIKAEKDNSVIM